MNNTSRKTHLSRRLYTQRNRIAVQRPGARRRAPVRSVAVHRKVQHVQSAHGSAPRGQWSIRYLASRYLGTSEPAPQRRRHSTQDDTHTRTRTTSTLFSTSDHRSHITTTHRSVRSPQRQSSSSKSTTILGVTGLSCHVFTPAQSSSRRAALNGSFVACAIRGERAVTDGFGGLDGRAGAPPAQRVRARAPDRPRGRPPLLSGSE